LNQFLEQKSEKALVGDNNSTVVNLENSLIVEILGVNNENLDFCEKKLKVKVLQKGNIVIITGNKKERYIVRNSIILLSRELKDPIKKHLRRY
jgi:phosphate starvation-inducible protein PhoH